MSPVLLSCGCWLVVASATPPVPAGTPMAPSARPTDLDRVVLAALKDVHNTGAELYNDGDHAGALRLYQGGLLVARPLLDHRPQQQAVIQEGLDQIAKSSAAVKLKAFRLHEVIEQVRADLKEAARLAAVAAKPAEAAAAGAVSLRGHPAAGLTVAFLPLNTTKPLATAKSDAAGAFRISTALPAGTYLVTLTGDGVPGPYAKAETTPLRAELKAGVNALTFDAK